MGVNIVTHNPSFEQNERLNSSVSSRPTVVFYGDNQGETNDDEDLYEVPVDQPSNPVEPTSDVYVYDIEVDVDTTDPQHATSGFGGDSELEQGPVRQSSKTGKESVGDLRLMFDNNYEA